MTLLSASKVWLWVQRDGGIWSFLIWTKNLLSLHRHPETSLEVVKETLLILQEISVTFSSNWPLRYQGGCFQVLISSKGLDSSICDRKINSPFREISPLSRWVFFLSRFPMSPSSPTPQGLQPVRHPSKFHPRAERIRGTIQVKLSFQIEGFATDPSQL